MRWTLAVLVAGTLGLTACSSSGSTSHSTGPTGAPSSTSASSTGGNPAVTAALNLLKPYESDNPSLALTPLSSKPPTGKTIDFVSCPLANCQEYLDGLKAAAAKLGWSVKSFNAGLTPDTVTSTWSTIAQNPGDGVVGISTLPNSSISGQLATLASKHVPVVQLGGPNGIGGAVIAQLDPQAQSTVQGQIWADWIVADSGAKAKIAYFTDPSFTDLKPYQDALTGELSKTCPACSVSIQTFNGSTGIGKSVPPQVVSYVQSNPDVQYIVVPIGDAFVGVPQALAAAGLSSKVKLVTGDSDVVNIQAIANDTQAMGVTGESYETGWRAADLLIRHFEGATISDPQPVGVLHVITKVNVPSNVNVPYSVPNYQAQYLKAWLLGS